MFNSAIPMPKFTTFEMKGNSESYTMRSIAKKKPLNEKNVCSNGLRIAQTLRPPYAALQITNNGSKPNRNLHAFALYTHNPLNCDDWILFRKVLRKMNFKHFFLEIAKRNPFHA